MWHFISVTNISPFKRRKSVVGNISTRKMQVSKSLLKSRRFAHFPFYFRRYISDKFVPKHQPVGAEDVQKLENFLKDKLNVLVLTGAGISTESGNYK